MKIIDKLSLQYKLYILLGLTIFGLIITAALGYYNMHKMKKNLDALYFGSLIPVNELNHIEKRYNKDILITFYQLQDLQITPAEAAEKIDLSRKDILVTWKSYRSHFKRDYEQAYLEYAHQQVEKSSHYLKRLSTAIMRFDEEKILQLSSTTLFNDIEEMNQIIAKLTRYEQDIAQYERKVLITTYNETLYKLLAILIFIIASAVLMIIPIFKSIQNSELYLIHTSKKLKKANKKLENASITDALTELYNRRYFNLVYNRELTRSIREHKSLAFMMIDVDYFKGYNDFYGHLQGDVALKSVAKTMKETLKRPGDFCFRLGGEEFGILIANITEDKAYHMAEKLRQRINQLKIPHEKSQADDFLSVSIGLVTLYPDHECEPEQILHEADANLYKAKERGRNQVISSELTQEKQISA
jgi:diguanylate cyclase (GGDEF)-like protein